MADTDEEREAEWKRGYHTDAKDKQYTLDKMSYEYLENTINLFSYLDVTPLRKALRAKKKALIVVVIDYLEEREKSARKKNSKTAKRQARRAKAARKALDSYLEVAR